jgi:hypothetical protein
LSASLGWTWEYIDSEMTLPRLYSLNKYWERHPPTHILLAAFMGVKPKEKKELSLDELIAEFGAAGLVEEKKK